MKTNKGVNLYRNLRIGGGASRMSKGKFTVRFVNSPGLIRIWAAGKSSGQLGSVFGGFAKGCHWNWIMRLTFSTRTETLGAFGREGGEPHGPVKGKSDCKFSLNLKPFYKILAKLSSLFIKYFIRLSCWLSRKSVDHRISFTFIVHNSSSCLYLFELIYFASPVNAVMCKFTFRFSLFCCVWVCGRMESFSYPRERHYGRDLERGYHKVIIHTWVTQKNFSYRISSECYEDWGKIDKTRML